MQETGGKNTCYGRDDCTEQLPNVSSTSRPVIRILYALFFSQIKLGIILQDRLLIKLIAAAEHKFFSKMTKNGANQKQVENDADNEEIQQGLDWKAATKDDGNIEEVSGKHSQLQKTNESEDHGDTFIMKVLEKRSQHARAEINAAVATATNALVEEKQDGVLSVPSRGGETESTVLDDSRVFNSPHRWVPGAPAVGIPTDPLQRGVPGAHAIPGPMAREDAPEAILNEDSSDYENIHVPEETGSPEQLDLELPIDGAVLMDAAEESATGGARDLEDGGNETEVLEGMIMKEQTNRVNWRVLAVVSTGLLVSGIVVLLALLLPSKTLDAGDHTGIKKEVATDPGTVANSPFREDLPHDILNTLFDVGSAYHLANAWMIQDPHLATYSPERQMQRFLMVYLYYTLNGHSWIQSNHWLSYEVSNCEWFNRESSLGIHGWHLGDEVVPTCDEKGNLQVLNLTSNNLDGVMPETTQHVSTYLKIFDFSDNQVQGQPPSFTANAMALEVVNISNNKYKGQLRGGALTPFNIRIIKLDGNQLLGYNPLVYRFLPRLEVLDLTGNLFDQYLTTEHIHNPNLTSLVLANNHPGFKGTIPSELSVLKDLTEIDLSGNTRIVGSIPTELALLSHLSHLDISGTSINGTIPESICARVKEGELKILADCNLVQCCEHV